MPRIPALAVILPSLSVSLLSGCSTSFVPSSTASSAPAAHAGPAISGSLFGGRQAIVGAKVFLLENGITGDAGPGIAPSTANSSVSLLSGTATTQETDPGPTQGFSYVLTDAGGGFSISGDYTCDAGRQVYIYALGGKPDGQTENDSAANVVALGTCPGAGVFSSSLHVYMNEVSTAALAFAAAGYATDATHISTSGTALATTGITNAFNNAAQLYDISDGNNAGGLASARATTPNGKGTVPQALLNSLGNTLAACVNSGGTSSAQCTDLFSNTADATVTPTDTVSAAINIAHHPATNVTTLFQLPSATGYPFNPNLGSTTPNDFTVAIAFGAIPGPSGPNGQPPVIDASGNVWIGNTPPDSNSTGYVIRYSPLGDSTTYTANFTSPNWTAISDANVPWVTNQTTSYGTIIVGPDQATPTVITADFYDPQFILFDHLRQVWVNEGQVAIMSVYDSTGTPVVGSPFDLRSSFIGWLLPMPDHAGHINAFAIDATTFQAEISQVSYVPGTGLNSAILPLNVVNYSYGGAFTADSGDNLWTYSIDDANNNAVLQKFSNSGTLLNTYAAPAVYTNTGYPHFTAIDGSGNIWSANLDYLAEQSSSGALLSPSAGGFGGGNGSGVFPYPTTVAIDGSGDAWVLTSDSTQTTVFLAEVIGIATPVITPISPNNPATVATTGTTGLGVRP